MTSPVFPSLAGIPVIVSVMAIVPTQTQRRRTRIVRGVPMRIKWRPKHGLHVVPMPGAMMFAGKLLVHPEVWPKFKAKIEAETKAAIP